MYLELSMVVLAMLAASKAHSMIKTRMGFNVKGQHVVVTGGSEGLGLAVATHCAQQGAKVTIMARTLSKLNKAKEEILAKAPHAAKGDILCVSCDVTDTKAVDAAFDTCVRTQGQAVDVYIGCAGIAVTGFAHGMPLSQYEKMINLNYLGNVRCVNAVLDSMVARRAGQIVLVGSTMSHIAFVGYTGYAASKYALKGYAEGLRHELLPHNVKVAAFYPASMDSPGFEVENRTKPQVTKEIEGSADLQTVEEASAELFAGLARGEFQITNDLVTYFLQSAGTLTAPRSNHLLEFLLAPVLHPILAVVLWWIDTLVIKSGAKKTQ